MPYQRDECARWPHDTLEAHPGQPYAAAMNASRGGSAEGEQWRAPDREVWCGGERGGGLGGNAAVVGKREGRRHIVVLCASEGTLRSPLARGSELPAISTRRQTKSRPRGRQAAVLVLMRAAPLAHPGGPPSRRRWERRPRRQASRSPLRRPGCAVAMTGRHKVTSVFRVRARRFPRHGGQCSRLSAAYGDRRPALRQDAGV